MSNNPYYTVKLSAESLVFMLELLEQAGTRVCPSVVLAHQTEREIKRQLRLQVGDSK